MRLSHAFFAWLIAASACGGSLQHAARSSPGKGPFTSCEEGQCVFDLAGDLESGAAGRIEVKPCPYAASCAVNHGHLSAAGRAAARAIRDELTKLELSRTYGCPGCADGPVFSVFVPRANAAVSVHSYDPSVEAEVPAELKTAHRFLRAIKAAASQCKSSVEVELDDCTPAGK